MGMWILGVPFQMELSLLAEDKGETWEDALLSGYLTETRGVRATRQKSASARVEQNPRAH